jgi:hypothetical protein
MITDEDQMGDMGLEVLHPGGRIIAQPLQQRLHQPLLLLQIDLCMRIHNNILGLTKY